MFSKSIRKEFIAVITILAVLLIGGAATVASAITVSGMVKDWSSNVITSPGVTVTLVSDGTKTTTASTTDGSFSLSGVPENTAFSLKFSRSGYLDVYSPNISAATDINLNVSGTGSSPFNMPTAADLAAFGAMPAAGKGLIAGRVTDATYRNSIAVGGVSVTATGNGGKNYPVSYRDPFGILFQVQGGMTYYNGHYYVLNVDDGDTVNLSASKNGWPFNPLTFNTHADGVGMGRITGAAPFYVEMSGSVIDTAGTGIPGAKLELHGDNGKFADAGSDGSYTFSGLPIDAFFYIKVTAPGYVSTYAGPVYMMGNVSGVNITLWTVAEMTGVGVTGSNGMLTCKVTSPSTNNPLSGATVLLRSKSQTSYTVVYSGGGSATNETGGFAVPDIQPGDMVEVTAIKAGYVFPPAYLDSFTSAVTAKYIIGSVQSPVSYNGFIQDKDNVGIEGATVEQVAASPVNTATSAAGTGAFTLNVSAGAPFYMRFSKAGFADTYTAEITLSQNYYEDASRGFNLFTPTKVGTDWGVASGKGIIRTRVRDQAGNYLGGVKITAQGLEKSYAVCYDDACTAALTATDAATGRYVVKNVDPADTVTATAQKAGWAFNQRTYRIYADSVHQGGIMGYPVTLSALSQGFNTAAAGTGSVNVTVAAGVPWSAISNDPWITVTSGAAGTGNGTVNFFVSANPGTASRTGTITIAGLTFTVTQAGTTLSDETLINAAFQALLSEYNKGASANIATVMSYFSTNYLNDGRNYAAQQADMQGGLNQVPFQPRPVPVSVTVTVAAGGATATTVIDWGGGDVETLYWAKEGDGVWRIVGNGSPYDSPSAGSLHNQNGQYYSSFVVSDPTHAIDSVTVTGEGISGTLYLTYRPDAGAWWDAPNQINYGVNPPANAQYQIVVSGPAGSYTYDRTINGGVADFATVLTPTGAVSGPLTFTFTGISGADYAVHLLDANWLHVWMSIPSSSTTVAYTGPALPAGTYYYLVHSSIGNNSSMAQGQFTYGAASGITVSGIVKDWTGNVISSPGVTVTLVGDETKTTTASTTDGNFSLPGVPANTAFSLRLSRTGYLDVYSPNISAVGNINLNVSATGSAPFNMPTAANLTAFGALPAAGKGMMAGRVADATYRYSAMAGGVFLTATGGSKNYPIYYRDSFGNLYQGGTTSGNGLYFVLNVDGSDTVILSASKSGWLFNPLAFGIHADSVSMGRIYGTAPGYVTMSGSVINTAGAGVSGARLELNGDNGKFVVAGGDGSYAFSGLPRDANFYIKTTAAGYVPHYASINLPGSISGISITPWTSAEMAGVGVTGSNGMIACRVTDMSLNALSGAAVTLQSKSGTVYTPVYPGGSGATSTAGTFFVPNIQAGDAVKVSVTKAGYDFAPVYLDGFTSAVTGRIIPGATPVVYNSYISDKDAVGIAGVTVEQVGASNTTTSSASPAGAFTLNVPNGIPFYLRFSKTGFADTYVAEMTRSAPVSESIMDGFTLQATTRLTEWNIPSGKGMVRARVKDSSGNYIAGAVVFYTSGQGRTYTVCYDDACTPGLTTTQGSSGRYIVRDVEPGDTVTVTARKAGYTFNTRILHTYADSFHQGGITGTNLVNLSATGQNFNTASTGTGSVNITAPGSVSWTAVSNDAWITVSAGSSGTGNGTVNFSVEANPGTAPRTGTITIGDRIFTITQAGTALSDEGLIDAAFRAAIAAYNAKDLTVLISYFSVNYLEGGRNRTAMQTMFNQDFTSNPNWAPKPTNFTISTTVNGAAAASIVTWPDSTREKWFFIREGSDWKMYGNQEKYEASAGSSHIGNIYYGSIQVRDPGHAIQSVRITGTNLSQPLVITWNSTQGGIWDAWQFMNYGQTPPANATYDIQITDAVGTYTYQRIINGGVVGLPANLAPAGTVAGNIIFTFAAAQGASSYTVQVYPQGQPGNFIWSVHNVPSTTISYAGPALSSGVSYGYDTVGEFQTENGRNISMASAQFTYSTGGISYTPMVYNVHASDGSYYTYLEVPIGTDFTGALPGAITALNVIGPGGGAIATLSNFEYLSVWREFLAKLPGTPAVGEYRFEMSSPSATTTVKTDNYLTVRNIPVPNKAGFSYSYTAGQGTTITWGAVTVEGLTPYYRLIIEDTAGNRVYDSTRIQGMLSHTVPDGVLQPDQTYRFQVRVEDAQNGGAVQNQARSDYLTFRLSPVSFTGYVADSQSPSQVIAGATVEQGGVPANAVPTDAAGLYTVGNLKAGLPFYLKIFKDASFAPCYSAEMTYTANRVDPRDRAFTLFPATRLGPGSGNWNVDADKGIIRAYVRDKLDNYIAGAVVTATGLLQQTYPVCYDDDCTPSLTATKDGNGAGRYVIKNVLDGDTVTVTAAKAGWTFNTRVYHTFAGGVSQGRITAQGAVSLAVTAVDHSNGSPTQGVQLQVVGFPDVSSGSGANGAATLTGLPPNVTIPFSLGKTGYVNSYGQFSASTGVSTWKAPLFAQADLTGWGVQSGKGVIYGRLIDNANSDDDTNSLAGVQVQYASAQGKSYEIVYINNDWSVASGATATLGNGRYLILNVVPGDTVTVSARKAGWSFWSNAVRGYADGVSYGYMRGTAGGATVTMSIVDKNNAAIAGATVRMAENTALSTTTDSSGKATLTNLPLDTPLTFEVIQSGYHNTYSRNVILTGNNSNWGSYILFSLDDTVSLGGIPVDRGVIIGWVRNEADGSTLAGAQVTFTSIRGNSYTVAYLNNDHTIAAAATATSSNGRFIILNVEPGDTVTATANLAGWTFTPRTYTARASSVNNSSLYGAVTFKGDLDGNRAVNLADAIIAIKVLSGMTPVIRGDYAASGADANNDGKIGQAELIFILQRLAETR